MQAAGVSPGGFPPSSAGTGDRSQAELQAGGVLPARRPRLVGSVMAGYCVPAGIPAEQRGGDRACERAARGTAGRRGRWRARRGRPFPAPHAQTTVLHRNRAHQGMSATADRPGVGGSQASALRRAPLGKELPQPEREIPGDQTFMLLAGMSTRVLRSQPAWFSCFGATSVARRWPCLPHLPRAPEESSWFWGCSHLPCWFLCVLWWGCSVTCATW